VKKKCVFCHRQSIESSVFCKRHRRLNRIKTRRRAKKLRGKGLCVKCGLVPPRKGRKTCRPCIVAWSKSHKKQTEIRKAKGICIRCGRKEAQENSWQCFLCLQAKRRARQGHDFFYRRAKGIIAATSNKHYIKPDIKAKELGLQLEEIWKSQRGFCCLSGRKLTKKNCHVDHIKPRSKGGKIEKENLRFLHKDVNQAKRSLTDSQFLKLCKDVLEHSK